MSRGDGSAALATALAAEGYRIAVAKVPTDQGQRGSLEVERRDGRSMSKRDARRLRL